MALATKETLQASDRVSPDSSARTLITPRVNLPSVGVPVSTGGGTQQNDAFDKAMFLTSPINKPKLSSSSTFSYNPLDVDTSGRYDRFLIGQDNEDIQGKLQSGWDKAANGLLKGVGIAGTTFLEGTVGLVSGLTSSIYNGSLNKFYNNDFSNYMSDLNKSMENILPNYYTAAEREAKWYEPTNWMTANFFWDKIIKNLGFSAGALGAGAVTAGLLGEIPGLFNISKAGKLAEVADALEAGLKGVPELERAAKAKDIIAQTSKTINTLNKIAAADRFVISGLGAATEGGIEALQGMNDYRDKLISTYRDKFGEDPTGEELNKINNVSADLGNARFGLNMLLLTGTNYIQLPKILGASYRSGKDALINSAKTNLETGLLESSLPTKGFGKALYKAKNIAGLFVSPSEGFEEGAQYAIERGTQEYYNKKDYKKDASLNEFLTNFGQAAGKGIKAVAEKEGMESVLIGALSGGIQQAGFVGTYKNEQGKTRLGFGKSGEIGERGLTGYGGEMAKNTADLVAKAKPFSLKGDNWLKDTTDAVVRGVALQEDFERSVRQGDILETKDVEYDYQQNYLLPRIKYGRYDLVKSDIAAYRQLAMTTEGFGELKQKGVASSLDTQDTFLSRLNGFEAHAKVVNSLNESLNLRYAGLVNKDTKERIYNDEVIDQMIYAASKISDYDNRIPGLSDSLLASGVDVQSVLGEIITKGTPNEEATKEALARIDELDVLSETKNELKSNLRDVIELSLRRKGFMKEYDNIKKNPKEYEQRPESEIEVETVNVQQQTTPEGEETPVVTEKEIQVGRDYSVGEPLAMVDGKLQFGPKINVLSKTLGGQFEVAMPNGEKEYLTPEQFKDYQISESANDTPELQGILDEAIDTVLNRKKYETVDKPTEDKLNYINSLNNNELAKDIQEEFRNKSKEYLQQRAKEDELKNSQEIYDALLATQEDNGIQQSDESANSYEPDSKKTAFQATNGTSAPVQGFSQKEPLAEHHVRSNTFGANFYSFENRDAIHGVIVTSGNEKELGLDGLTQWLKDEGGKYGEKVEPTETIVLVAVEIDPKTKARKLVGVDGKPLDVATLKNTIYQTFPKDLVWSNGKSMLRKSIPDATKKLLTAEYNVWRTATLAAPNLDPHKLDVSFGIPQPDGTLNDKGEFVPNKNAKIAVTQSALISEDDLRTQVVVRVPTTEGATSNGSVTFKNGLGLSFLLTTNGMVKLNNSQISKEKAEVVYDVMTKLSENLFKSNNLKSDESKLLYNWLKSVIYWGTPNNEPGHNSVFFSKTDNGLVLYMSKDPKNSFPFQPSDMKLNKDKIIAELQKLYTNTNSTLVKGGKTEEWNKPYKEIVSMKDGNIQTRQWLNYQSFLLSDKFVSAVEGDPENGKPRTDIPLTTKIRAVKDVSDINRQGIYFTLKDKQQTPDVEVVQPIAKEAVVAATPAPETVVAPQGFKLDGTENTAKIGAFGNASFTLDEAEYLAADKKRGIKLFPLEDATKKKIVDFLVKDGKIDPTKDSEEVQTEKAEGIARMLIKKQVDKQLASAPVVTEAAPISDDIPVELKERMAQQKANGSTQRGSNFRLAIEKDMNKFKGENWSKVEQWLKDKFPNVPVYVVKNVIQATNGRQAWGMLHDGAIYLYENAPEGTVYHEVFEAVWKMFTTPEERAAVLKEFKGRKGSFEDRVTGNVIKYSEATDQDAKEQLAEENRAVMLGGKLPAFATEGKSLIGRIFARIANFFNTFFRGKDAAANTANLFAKIGNGYYKQFSPYDSQLAFAKTGFLNIENAQGTEDSEYSLTGFTGSQVHDVMQQMTYTVVKDQFETNQGLFDISKLNKTDLYIKLKGNLLDLIAENMNEIAKSKLTKEEKARKTDQQLNLFAAINSNWEKIKERHEEYLNSYDIQFDENDNDAATNIEKAKDETYAEANKIDTFRKANPAIKLLFATLPVVDINGNEKLSSIGGFSLLPVSEMFISVMNNVHTARNIDEMISKLQDLADEDPKYRKLVNRLTKMKSISDLDNINDIQLVTAFWKAFKKQSPDVKSVYILENGDVIVGDANFSSATRQVESEFINSIKNKFKATNPFFKYSEKSKSYIANEGEEGLSSYTLDSKENQLKFLKDLGIIIDPNKLDKLPEVEQGRFFEAIKVIRTSLLKLKKISSIDVKSLDSAKQFRRLAELKAKMDNPEFSSTYFNVKGERTQSFIGTNAASELFDALSQIQNKQELKGTDYEYLLTDAFSQNSTILDLMFDRKTGKRIQGSENLMKTAYASGTVNKSSGKQKSSNNLTYKERLVQEINLNLEGYYLNLVPGDASIEWMTYMGNKINAKQLLDGFGDIHNVFRGYFIDEMNLAREKRRVAKNRTSSDLRFFESILPTDVYNTVMADKASPEEVYNTNKEAIDKAVTALVEKEALKLKGSLTEYGILQVIGNEWFTENVAFKNPWMDDNELTRELNALSASYAINNIEMHKLLYSDPYQYEDELKRIKNFNSPRQAIIHNSSSMNKAFDKVWNKGYSKNDIGYTNMNQDYFRSTTLTDIKGVINLPGYKDWDEGDGGGVILFRAHRNLKIRASEWDQEQEKQYRYDIAWEKQFKGRGVSQADKVKRGIAISEEEKALLDKGNPQVTRTYTPVKPIVAGNKANGKNYNDVMLDKFALYPLSFRVLHEINPTANMLKLYDKMENSKLDYIVFNSARKVGAEEVNDVYNADTGEFNINPYKGIINVPFSIMSIQSEIPSKDVALVTRGSQITKLVTLDFMEAGVPIDFNTGGDFADRYKAWFALPNEEARLAYNDGVNLYKEIKENQNLLEEMIKEGIDSLLERFDIKKDGNKYILPNVDKLVATLQEEMTKRAIDENISDALRDLKTGAVVLEATAAYKQIRNILYSIADQEVISPKISGGQKVQMSVALLESVKAKQTTINDKQGFTSDTLKFYKNAKGERVCEVMLGRWFDSDMSDEELLKYLNDTDEGKEILSGIGFRIPTQKQNSIDVFRIAKFLPKEFGDSIVIPSALVAKAGSDFDIDKLSVYLKNVDVNKKTGEIRIVPYQGIGTEAKEKFRFVDDYKKSLENGYIQSLQNLVSHELNFDNLIKPNSADDLKKLAKTITDKLGEDTFDYKAVGNMLSRDFMSKLRHAFVTGKYAIGIAAVNQTNHSLNQRQPIYINKANLSKLSRTDKKYIGNADIKFADYNTIGVNGDTVGTLSMIKNKAGDYISDILGQFIDGFVDIAKGPWIMQLGATPNVASTYMFLVKMGVPVKNVAYFMNQPIIRDYLKSIEKEGYTWLFIDDIINETKGKYGWEEGDEAIDMTIPDDTSLLETIGKKDLTKSEDKQQVFMLDEFLKYAKMAEQMFLLTQGTNFDTASFNDPYLVSRKLNQLEKARNTIFSSADDLLKNSFVGKLESAIKELRNALATMLKSDQGYVRTTIDDVLKPYMSMNERDFVKNSQRAVSSLFDWLTQTTDGLNHKLLDILVNDTNVAKQMTEFIESINPEDPLANNQVIKVLKPLYGDPGQVNNLQIKNKDNKAYDKNQLIYAFRELKEELNNRGNIELYDRLVELAILQSGLTDSTISFTDLLPYEDMKGVYNNILSTIEDNPAVKNYHALNVFERNFWSYDDVVPHKKARTTFNIKANTSEYNNNMAFKTDIFNAIKNGRLPNLLKINNLAKEADNDVIVYTWKEIPQGKTEAGMIKDADFSFIKRGLFKKVRQDNGKEFSTPSGYGSVNYIYRAINAWGDGIFANEFYNIAQKSKLDNGFIQADESISDETIRSYFNGQVQRNTESDKPEIVRPETILIPKYVVNDFLKNADGSKRLASTDGAKISINPVKSVDEFFKYFEGKEAGTTSQQKASVLAKLGEQGWSIDNIKNIINTTKLANTFLVLHEQSHIENGDKDVYWLNGKDLLSEDKVAIEARATIDALVKLGGKSEIPTSEEPAKDIPVIDIETRYKDSEKRLRIDYPAKIKTVTGDELNSTDLIRASNIKFDGSRIAEEDVIGIDEYPIAIRKKYGKAAGEYAESYETSIPEAEFLRDNSEFAERFIDSYLEDALSEGKNLSEYAQALLDQNEKLVDTAQLDIFKDVDINDEEGSDNPTPCVVI